MELNRRAVWLSLLSLSVIVVVDLYVFSLGQWYRLKAIRLHVLGFIVFFVYLMCRYVWRRLSCLLPKDWSSLASVPKFFLLIVLTLALGCIPLGHVFMGTEDPPIVNRLTNVCLGIVIFLTTSLVGMDVCVFVLRVVLCRVCGGRQISREEEEANRKLVTLLALVVALVLVFSGFLGVSRFTVERVRLPIKNLDPKLNGTTIVHLSDIHLGPYNGRLELMRIVGEVNRLNGDLVVITGDLVDSSVVALRRTVKPLTTIRSKYGVYFSPG